ncbi:MAG: hypothetical protein ACM3XN_04140 [Chloroflexota bacterium]
MENDHPEPKPAIPEPEAALVQPAESESGASRLRASWDAAVRFWAALKTALCAAVASVLFGLGLSAGLSVVVGRWLTASLDAAPGGNFSLVSTFSMFMGSHLVTVRTRSHAAFLNIDVTLRAGLIILLLVPLISIGLGTALFRGRFRARARLSPAWYVGLTGLLYAIMLGLMALLSGGPVIEAFACALVIALFAAPGASLGGLRRRRRSDEGDAQPDAVIDIPASGTAAGGTWQQRARAGVPAVILGMQTLVCELLALTVFSLLAFTSGGSVPRSLLLAPNVAVYALALVHGAPVVVLSNLQRIGNVSVSVITGLQGAGGSLAQYGQLRLLLLLIPLSALIAGGIALERRRRIGRLAAALSFGLGYGGLGGFLVWACAIRFDATGAAVSLLSDTGAVSVRIGAPWLMALPLMIAVGSAGAGLGCSLAGGRARRDSQPSRTARNPWLGVLIVAVAIVVTSGGLWVAPRVVPAVSDLLWARTVTFSLPLPDLQQAVAVAERDAGGYVVAGYAASDPGQPLIVALDGSGAKLWAHPVDLGQLADASGDRPAASAPPPGAPEVTRPRQRVTYRYTVRLIAALPGGDIALAGTRFGAPHAEPDRRLLQLAGLAPTSEDAYVARLDSEGRPLWVAVWSDEALSPSGPMSLTRDTDGGLRLVARVGPLGRRRVAEIDVTPTGGLSLISTGASNPVAGLGPDTPSFAVLIERQCVPLAAAPLMSGGTVACGYVAGPDGAQTAFLALVDGAGQLRWLRGPTVADLPALSAVLPTSDGGFIAVGVRGAGAWVLKTDGRGLIKGEPAWR